MLGAGKIITLDPMDKKLEMSKKFGQTWGSIVSKYSDAELVQYIRDETQGRGADVVVENCGSPEVLKVGLEMLCRAEPTWRTGNSSIPVEVDKCSPAHRLPRTSSFRQYQTIPMTVITWHMDICGGIEPNSR